MNRLTLVWRRSRPLLTFVAVMFLAVGTSPAGMILADLSPGLSALLAGACLSGAAGLITGRTLLRDGMPPVTILNPLLPVWAGMSLGLWRGEQFASLSHLSALYLMTLTATFAAPALNAPLSRRAITGLLITGCALVTFTLTDSAGAA